MKDNRLRVKILIIALTFFSICQLQAQIQISDLTCEYLKDPIGIGVIKPRLFWKLDSPAPDQIQTAYQILVASAPSLLSENKADCWNSGKINSDQSIQLEYNGKTLKSRDACWWKVRVWDKDGKRSEWSQPAYFEIGLLSPEEWKADWIKTAIKSDDYSYPSPILRHEFSLGKKIQKARAYVTALGLYEMYINGDKVGERLLTPGFTSYEKRNQYQVYDVTSMMKSGKNALGLILGNGWYRNYRANPNEAPDLVERTRQDLLVIAQVEVNYTDGTKEIITTGPGWKSSTGPILMTSIYNGETYDARLEKPDWSTVNFDDKSWQGIEVVPFKKETIMATVGPPVKRMEEIKPLKIIHTPAGDTIVDMGQNMAGWCRLKVNGPTGTTITLRHGEMLDKFGNFYTANLRSAKQTITYTCKGGGEEEIYEPRFTFQGFRYVAVSGYPRKLTTDAITGIVFHTEMEQTGTFICSDSLVNKLYQNIVWSQKGNSIEVPTDCPQRDERMGWLGDAQLFAPAACYNMMAAGFYTKWMKDIITDQLPSGPVFHMAPKKLNATGAFGYSDAVVIIPWLLYQRYGDIRILQDHYESMKAFVESEYKKTKELSRFNFGGYADWLAFEGDYRRHYSSGQSTDKDMLGTAYLFYSTKLLGQIAGIVGKQVDAANYGELAERIRNAFKQEFVTPKGRLSTNTQTAYSVALSFDVLTEDVKRVIAGRLAENVNTLNHIATGIMGTREICLALTDNGYIGEAYKLLFRKEFPSWLYMVSMGGTTIWERWDGLRPDSTFQKPQMNSFNHPAFGSVGDWLYRKVAGIESGPEAPGFKSIVIKPFPGGEMKEVKASYESLYGTIRSEWKIEGGKFKLKVEIPVNTKATIKVPSVDHELTMNGRKLNLVKQQKVEGLSYHFNTIEIGSGQYEFMSNYTL
jgi:alpha-L-rhamnosidase